MTKPDFLLIFDLLYAAFRVSEDEKKADARAGLYWTKFKDTNMDVFKGAVHRHIEQGAYFPTVKELRTLAEQVIGQQERMRRPDPMNPYEGVDGDYAARRRRQTAGLDAERMRELALIKEGKPIPGIGVVPVTEDGRIDFMGAWAIMQANLDAGMMARAKEPRPPPRRTT